jgi:hypothetical protein
MRARRCCNYVDVMPELSRSTWSVRRCAAGPELIGEVYHGAIGRL